MVYVVVPIHNRKEITLNFLRNFQGQIFQDYKIIIVDDGSSDGSSDAIGREFPQIEILKGNGQLWWTGSINLGVKKALNISSKGDFILIINDDLKVEEKYLENLLDESNKYERSIIGSSYRDEISKELFYSGVNLNWKKYRYERVDWENEDVIADINILPGRGTLIPVEVFDKIGLFDEKLRHYLADYEFFLRAKKKKFNLIVCKKAIVCGTEDDTKNRDGIVMSPAKVFFRVFNMKSNVRLYNHIYLICKHCPSLRYKIVNIAKLVLFNLLLFFISLTVYPVKKISSHETSNKLL